MSDHLSRALQLLASGQLDKGRTLLPTASSSLRPLTCLRAPALLKAVLQGERIRGYPTLEDIEDRTDLYDIQF